MRDATRTNIVLGTNYKADRDPENLINFHKRLRNVCYKSDDGGLSYKPYKIVVSVKSLHKFSNSKPNDSHAFKEETKIKFGAVSTTIGKFLDKIGVLNHLLKAETPSQD